MSMYLPNEDLRPTGSEIAEFIDDPTITGDHARGKADQALAFLRDLEAENASISDDVVQIGHGMWGVHGVIAVDGDVLMGEFDSYDAARRTLERLRDETQMPCHLAESPLTCVAVGSGRSLEEFEAIHRSSKNSRNRRRRY